MLEVPRARIAQGPRPERQRHVLQGQWLTPARRPRRQRLTARLEGPACPVTCLLAGVGRGGWGGWGSPRGCGDAGWAARAAGNDLGGGGGECGGPCLPGREACTLYSPLGPAPGVSDTGESHRDYPVSACDCEGVGGRARVAVRPALACGPPRSLTLAHPRAAAACRRPLLDMRRGDTGSHVSPPRIAGVTGSHREGLGCHRRGGGGIEESLRRDVPRGRARTRVGCVARVLGALSASRARVLRLEALPVSS